MKSGKKARFIVSLSLVLLLIICFFSCLSLSQNTQHSFNGEINSDGSQAGTSGKKSVTEAAYGLSDSEGMPETSRFIVKYKNMEDRKGIEEALAGKMKKLKRLKGRGNFDLIITNRKMKKDELLSEIKQKKADSNIEYIQPDYKLTLSSDDPYFDNQWGLYNRETVQNTVYGEVYMDANVVPAWEISQGEGVTVAVIDTGVDITHEDLSENIWNNSNEIPDNGLDDDGNGYVDDVNGWNFFDDNNLVHSADTVNDEEHGTHIAGIIAAVKDNNKGIAGVAPKSRVMPLKVFKNGTAYTSDIIETIDYAHKMGAKVVNCSWGTSSDNLALKEAMQNADMLFVCAAGNSGLNIDMNPIYPASYDLGNVISAVSINKDGLLSSFSNYGEISIDVAAPGEEIISTLPGNTYGHKSGTSMAAAFISGEAALIYSKKIDTSYEEIVNTLKMQFTIGKNSYSYEESDNYLPTDDGYTLFASYDSEIISDTIPTQMEIGRSYTVSVTVRNTGTNTWTREEGYKLGGVGDNDPFASARQYLLSGESIGSNQTKTFTFTMVAPTVVGTYTTDWRMLREGVCWFGDKLSKNVSVVIWTTKASMPTERACLGAAAVNGKIYAIGGYNTKNAVEEYNPSTNTWVAKTNMPTARHALGAATVNGKIYAIGGSNGSYLNTVEEYNPTTNTWTTKASMPTARYYFGAATVNGKIYAIGGYNGSYLDTVEEYDPVTDTWATKASMPTARRGCSVAAVNGKIYVIGGFNGSTLNIVEVYDPATDTWATKANMFTERYDPGVAVANGKIYVMGGSISPNGYCYNTVEEYDPTKDTWIEKESMQTARRSLGAIGLNGKLYAIGGWNGSNNLNNVEEYTPVKEYWTTKAGMPTERACLGTATVNGKIYAIGGYNTKNAVEEYNPSTNTWVAKTNMPTARHALGVAAVNGKIYAIGGSNGSYLNTAEEYDPVTNTWTTKASMLTARYYFGVAAINGKIYAIGGYNGSCLDTVEEYDPVTDTWATKASMPTARRGCSVIAVNGKIYAIGGDNGSTLNIVEEYDPATDTWMTKANMYTGRYDPGVAVANGKIYVMGGSISLNGYCYNTVEEYDPTKDTWIEKESMQTARRSLEAIGLNGKVYAIGGWNGSNNLNNVEEYSPKIPTNINAVSTSTSIVITWDALNGATGYDIEVDGTVIDNGTNTSYAHTDLITNSQHTYRVRAENPSGTGEWSEPIAKTVTSENTVSYSVYASMDKLFYIVIDGLNIQSLTDKNFIVSYNTDELELIDLCAEEYGIETNNSNPDSSNIEIIEYIRGTIIFKLNKPIDKTKYWTGAINAVKFKSKISSGTSTITCEISK